MELAVLICAGWISLSAGSGAALGMLADPSRLAGLSSWCRGHGGGSASRSVPVPHCPPRTGLLPAAWST